jgi:hypothetical protein
LISCKVKQLWELKSQTVNHLGKDQTGKIKYQFNKHGWRSSYDYSFIPDYAFFGCSLVLGIGVEQEQIFPSLFESSHNYGLAIDYTNQNIVDTILDFTNSEWYAPSIKMCVVWSDRDPEIINRSWQMIAHLDIVHFFCGLPIPSGKSWPMIKNVDYDASGTHMGPKTHKIFYKTLCNLFKQ